MRHVIGIPYRRIRWLDQNQADFVGMVDWILQLSRPRVLTISSFPFLLQTCPGGMEYLMRHGFSFHDDSCRVRVHDLGHLWSYQNPENGEMVRSLEYLYHAIEDFLASSNGRFSPGVFLLTSGNPEIGNSLVDVWKERHAEELRIHTAQSPVDVAGDYLRSDLKLSDTPISRTYLSGPEVIEAPIERLAPLTGLILLMSVEDTYRRSSKEPRLVPRVFDKLAKCYGPDCLVYAFHANADSDVKFRSTLGAISGDLEKPDILANSPYTFAFYRE